MYACWYSRCYLYQLNCCVFFQAEDGIRDLVRSRGLGDVYKRQASGRSPGNPTRSDPSAHLPLAKERPRTPDSDAYSCLLYTSDAADDLLCVDLGGRRILQKKHNYAALDENQVPSGVTVHSALRLTPSPCTTL